MFRPYPDQTKVWKPDPSQTILLKPSLNLTLFCKTEAGFDQKTWFWPDLQPSFKITIGIKDIFIVLVFISFLDKHWYISDGQKIVEQSFKENSKISFQVTKVLLNKMIFI